MRPHLLPSLVTAALLFGCAETGATCEDGLVRRESDGECVPLEEDAGGGGADGGLDAGAPDAGGDGGGAEDAGGEDADLPDGGVDAAMPDGGPCAEPDANLCPTERPYCSGAGACVACTEDAHCDADLATPICGTDGVCRACAVDTECSVHADGLDYCDEDSGRCEACTADSECPTDWTCSQLDHTCQDVAPMDLFQCQACSSDTQCGSGLFCVEHTLGTDPDVSLGHYCSARPGTSGSCEGPYTRSVSTRTSTGGEAGTFCLPPARTSCEAVISYRMDTACPGTGTDPCGRSDVDDSYCPTSGSRMGFCSYRCSSDIDCFDGDVRTCATGASVPHCLAPAG